MTFTFERRLATFKELKWPHTSNKKYKSQPEDFAQAGFYFRPLAGSDDTVSCYLCFKSLDGWEPNDCAWHEHQSHSAPCPLVTLNLFSSRLKTFDKWPGAKVKGGVRALAEAGFYYLPKDDADESCTCYQCGVSLDGWETDDDPLRKPNCPHIVNQEYIKPASFEFILANEPDDLAICDINHSKNTATVAIPQTPASKVTTTAASTVKPKKIKISVPQSAVKPVELPVKTPQSTRSQPRVIASTTKKQAQTQTNAALKTDLLNLFPSLKAEQGNILNWTMEELLDHLIKEKVEMFKEFLSNKANETVSGTVTVDENTNTNTNINFN